MPLKPSTTIFRALRAARPSPSPSPSPILRISPACGRLYSTAADDATPPMLTKLKADLKTAMRARDTVRLSVLRAIMSANLNASKTASPNRTDVQLVALIRKMQKSAADAAAEARNVGRDDLVQKEEAQIKAMGDIIANSGVQTLGEAELEALVRDAVEAAKAAGASGKAIMGDVMKRLGGALEGKDVDRKELAKMVKALTE